MCISISKSKSCYVYCHLGNIRHVDKAGPDNRGHEIVQVNNYYPYGSIHADGNRGQEVQTHKYVRGTNESVNYHSFFTDLTPCWSDNYLKPYPANNGHWTDIYRKKMKNRK